MFFMMGITPGRKDFDFHQMVLCDQCGSYGQYRVFMTYMCLSLFFIPVFRWKRQYYVESSCCGTVWQLDPEVGKRIARGEDVEIRPGDITVVSPGRRSRWKRCENCGFETQEDFEFCPKCGTKL